MIDPHTPQTISAADAVPWVLGNQLQPHRGRWLGRRARPDPWVFLGLRGLVSESRMQGLPCDDGMEMTWLTRFGPDGRPRRERPGPIGPMGPAGPAGKNARADRPPAGPPAGTGGPVAAPEPPAIHPPIGMFIFQQAAGHGPLPHPARSAAPLAGIFSGRTGGMTSGTIASTPFSSGGLAHLSPAGNLSSRSVSIQAPSERSAETSDVVEDGLPARPQSRPEAIPQPAGKIRTDGISRTGHESVRSGGPAGLPFSRNGAFEPDERVWSIRLHAPGLGVLGTIVSLLPGIGWRPRSDMPEGDDGFLLQGRGDGGQGVLPAVREPEPNEALPMRRTGRVPPDGPRPGIPGDLTDQARSLSQDDLPLPVAHPRGKEMDVMVSAIEQAVVRQVDKALNERHRRFPPGRPAPEGPAPPPDIESDRVARRLANRIRRLAQDDRFRRGQLR